VELKERITQVIMSLPLDLEKDRCEQFGEQCGQRCNDISHYGGRRDNSSSYDEFHGDLYFKSEALFYLLHALILQELGIPASRLPSFFVHPDLAPIRTDSLPDRGISWMSVRHGHRIVGTAGWRTAEGHPRVH
jgi:hypothetical protein